MEINWPVVISIVITAANLIYTWAVMHTEQKTQAREIRDLKTWQGRTDADLRAGAESRAGMAANIEAMKETLARIEKKLDRDES